MAIEYNVEPTVVAVASAETVTAENETVVIENEIEEIDELALELEKCDETLNLPKVDLDESSSNLPDVVLPIDAKVEIRRGSRRRISKYDNLAF